MYIINLHDLIGPNLVELYEYLPLGGIIIMTLIRAVPHLGLV